MKRLLLTGLPLVLGAVLLAALAGGRASSRSSALPTPRPTVNDYVQLTTSETPPTQAQCNSVGRRCFTPQSTRASYNLSPLYAAGANRAGRHDRDRRRLRERHDRARPARLRHAVRAAADVRRGGRHRARRACRRSASWLSRARRRRRRRRRRATATGSRTSPHGRSRSPSTSRRRTRSRPGRTSCSSPRPRRRRSASRASRR